LQKGFYYFIFCLAIKSSRVAEGIGPMKPQQPPYLLGKVLKSDPHGKDEW